MNKFIKASQQGDEIYININSIASVEPFEIESGKIVPYATLNSGNCCIIEGYEDNFVFFVAELNEALKWKTFIMKYQ